MDPTLSEVFSSELRPDSWILVCWFFLHMAFYFGVKNSLERHN